MAEDRQLPAESLVQTDMLGQRGDPLFGPDDVGDAHQMVVNHIGQMVGREAVRLDEHLVIDLGVVDCDFASQEIDDRALAL